MGALIDVLGAMVIGAMLLMMMITFQYQLRDTADSAIYMSNMIREMQQATKKLNGVISLAGIGVPPENTVTIADSTTLRFVTQWDYNDNAISFTTHTIELRLANNDTELGRELTVFQDGLPVQGFGQILWIKGLRFVYFDKTDHQTSTMSLIRSVELWLTFQHNAPTMDKAPLHTRLQMRCFFMNSFLAGA